jgi:hypothetical protein
MLAGAISITASSAGKMSADTPTVPVLRQAGSFRRHAFRSTARPSASTDPGPGELHPASANTSKHAARSAADTEHPVELEDEPPEVEHPG